MTASCDPTVHASAVQVGTHAILIRGPSGAGKSRLAFDLILAGRTGQIAPSMLVGDDRIHLERRGETIVARPAPQLTGLIEIRGLGIRRLACVAFAPVGLIVDLVAPDAARLPAFDARWATVLGIKIPRIPVGTGYDPLPLVVAELVTAPHSLPDARSSSDCQKQFGNHISPTIVAE
jgi:serine kinase of HPr protein (carbohydrate metabolism regulator)